MAPDTVAIICARNEADRIGATLDALRSRFPGAALVVGDDASTDATAAVAAAAGAIVVSGPHAGKGANATRAAHRALELGGHADAVYLICDADLGASAAELEALVEAVRDGEADLAVAAFARRTGGGFGIALRFAAFAIRRRAGLDRLRAPISGQRAMRGSTLARVLPFADGFGMEIGMTVDAARAGFGIAEIELDLEHRATGRDWRGFAHRARQLKDFVRVYRERR
jgi:glycosyltransferase involved in cell wall biosynthesis